MLRRERLPHDQADALDVGAAAGELGREGQELLVEEALRVEGAEQSRPALDEDELAGARPAHLVEDGARANRAAAAPHRAELHRIGNPLLRQLSSARAR